MNIKTLVLDGREYVMVPRKTWDALSLQQSRASRSGGRGKQLSFRTIEDVRGSLAAKVLAQRKAAGLTQNELAKQSGVRVETINRLERGLHMPGAATFEKIERALERGRSARTR